MLALCCGTWKRYDLLNNLIQSAETGHTPPDKFIIFDNGGSYWHHSPKVEIYRPGHNLGIAGAWNYILNSFPNDFKIFSNDDVTLFPYTLTMFTVHQNDGDFLVTGGLPILNAFTLCSVNQRVIDTVGYMDDSISPGYAYFEDNDYGRRIHLAGLKRFDVPCSALHEESGTLKVLSGTERSDHARKFALARENYKRKWGGLPAFEEYSTPYNQGGSLYCPYHPVPVERVK